MKFNWRSSFCIFGIVLAWRVALLLLTAQPIPANDAFGYDGAVVNLLHGGRYVNPSLAEIFPISGREIYATYPPVYQGVLLLWMKIFGTGALAAMALHLLLFAIAGWLALGIIRKFFPASANHALPALLFFGLTFGDRPEDLAHIFGLGSLWLVAGHVFKEKFEAKFFTGLVVLLLLALYTSPIVGALYFGAGVLSLLAGGFGRRNYFLFLPFVLTAVLFALITAAVAGLEPRWWAGFMESARQQSVVSSGFHAPHFLDFLKLLRAAPVFVLALIWLPVFWVKRREMIFTGNGWGRLLAGILMMGWILLAADLTLLASNYVGQVVFLQIILAAGMLSLVKEFLPAQQKVLRFVMAGCVLLVSVRAVGMTTWGAVCASQNSYGETRKILRAELEPFTSSDTPVLISSAFLYSALESGVRRPLHADWYFDHASWTNQSEVNALIRLKPSRLVLTQFDYHRSFIHPLAGLAQHADEVEIHVRDFAKVRTPDSIPALQRVLQHISWAPVIVDLHWKEAPLKASAPPR